MWLHPFLTLSIFALLEREGEGSSGERCNMPCTFLYSFIKLIHIWVVLLTY